MTFNTDNDLTMSETDVQKKDVQSCTKKKTAFSKYFKETLNEQLKFYFGTS